MEMDKTELLNRVRSISPGIAEWVDACLRSGAQPTEIIETLRATVAAVEAERPA
jgi:hypothetical protein